MSTEVLLTQQQHIGIITLNRIQALNALTLPMVQSIYEALMTWQDNSSIHAVVIRSAGGKAFCAGGDVRWLYEAGLRNIHEQMQFFKEEYRLNQLIHHYNKPYIALMDGLTMGGGVGISLHGSHPVATHDFVFAMPETSIGFFPDIGASYLLSRLPGAMGIYLGLTGNRLKAEDACTLNLVKHLILASNFDPLIDALKDTDLSHDAHQKVSTCLSRFSEPVNHESIEALQSKVDISFSYSNIVSIVRKLEMLDDAWHREILVSLKQKSPLSLCVTLEQLLRAADLSFDECIEMDSCIVKHFMSGHDFYEGVRALLIDKDKSPKWEPDSILKIEQQVVFSYFIEDTHKLT